MAQDLNGYGHPSPHISVRENSSTEYRHRPGTGHPYTPPRMGPSVHFGYSDPSEYELAPTSDLYSHLDSYDSPSYHTPPPSHGPVMKTRSGRVVRSAIMTPDNVSSTVPKLPRAKKPKAGKKVKGTDLTIQEPLSIVTKDYDVPVMDMMAWATRPEEDRHKELKTRHKGKTPRPMNSFMLYRRAYKERIKKWGQQGDNNQLISKVAGMSWKLEPQELRDFYAKCATVEKDNHARAFPNYKFAPNKNPRKRTRLDDDEYEDSDPEWTGSSAPGSRRSRRKMDVSASRSLSSTPGPVLMHMAPPHSYHHPSSFQASNPQGMLPDMYVESWRRPVQYHQLYPSERGYSYMLNHHDMYLGHGHPIPPHSNYASHLVGIPSRLSEEVLIETPPFEEYGTVIDPNLGHLESVASYQYDSYPSTSRRQVAYHGDAQVFEAESQQVAHPGMQMLTSPTLAWPEYSQGGNSFDAEFRRSEDVEGL